MGELVTQLRFLERPAAGEPAGALVLLHGRGADEHDLFPLLDALDPERRLLGITPRAPLSLPPGGAHWYRLGGIPTPDPETFFPTFEAAAAFLEGLPVPIDRVVLGGFSQGAVMSWALGLGAGRPRPAAIIALSGFMPEADGFELDLTELEGYPIVVAHGSLDPVIPAEFVVVQILHLSGKRVCCSAMSRRSRCSVPFVSQTTARCTSKPLVASSRNVATLAAPAPMIAARMSGSCFFTTFRELSNPASNTVAVPC